MKLLTAIALASLSCCAEGASGLIQGSVTTSGGQPITTGSVEAFDLSGTPNSSAGIDAVGNYAITVTWAGTAPSTFTARTVSTGYLDEIFDNIPCPDATCAPTSGVQIRGESRRAAVVNFVLQSDLVFGDGFEGS
jgi:hypothetical protein